jgi:putative membrane protein
MTYSDLPAVNAALNGLSATLLTVGFICIKQRRVAAHRTCMLGALASSTLFLICYVTYHTYAGRTVFREPAWFRPIYLTILFTHTVLAVTIVPMVLITARRALAQRFELHKKIARWTWPLWMYVSLTGVLIYYLLYHRYPQQ